MQASTKFSELPAHEIVRTFGQLSVQGGLFLIAVSSVLKHLGNLPEVPLTPPGSEVHNSTINTSQAKGTGYFD
jgi:hypothetical protein